MVQSRQLKANYNISHRSINKVMLLMRMNESNISAICLIEYLDNQGQWE